MKVHDLQYTIFDPHDRLRAPVLELSRAKKTAAAIKVDNQWKRGHGNINQ